MLLRLGTRGSALARWQAEWVAAQLRQHGVDVELLPIVTSGDRRQEVFEAGEGQGLFTKEIQLALLDDRIDLAVHSFKDLPTATVAGLSVAAVPPRATTSDVLICRGDATLATLSAGAVVGTGSVRRRAQLLHVRSDLQMKDIRGNVDSRLRKLREGHYDAIVLAEAGLRRLGLDQEINEVLPPVVMLPAAGQGALALEIRADDEATRRCVTLLDDPSSHRAVLAERAALAALQGGCTAPVAVLAIIDRGRLHLTCRVISEDGREMLEERADDTLDRAERLGRDVAGKLLERGADRLIAAARNSPS